MRKNNRRLPAGACLLAGAVLALGPAQAAIAHEPEPPTTAGEPIPGGPSPSPTETPGPVNTSGIDLTGTDTTRNGTAGTPETLAEPAAG